MTPDSPKAASMRALLMLAGIVMAVPCAQETPVELPADPCARCAVKALRGDYGRLASWQQAGYARILSHGSRRVCAWVTTYYPEEGFPRGDVTASGYGCSEQVVAANELSLGVYVWHPHAGLRQVLDRGARRNDRNARRLGAALWVDYWEPRRGSLFGDDNAGVQELWVVR